MFEATLNVFRGTEAARRKLKVMPLAVLLHLIAFAGVAMAGLLTVRELPEPILTATFYHVPAPPAAPPRSQGVKPATPRATTLARPAEVVQIHEIPADTPKNEPSQQVGDYVDGSLSDEDGEGGDGEITGGFPETNTPSQPARTEPQDEEPLDPHAFSELIAPVPLQRPAPAYPEVARRARLQGKVLLRAVIDREGNVVNVQILRDIGLGCGVAAAEAVQRWRYRPATLNGRRVPVFLTVAVTFGLA